MVPGAPPARNHHDRVHVQLVGRRCRVLAKHAEHIARPGDRKGHGSGDDFALHRVQPELEVRHYAEVAAATAQTPEQLRVLFGTGVAELPVGSDHIQRLEVVDGHAELARQAPETSTQREPAHPGVGHRAERRDQPMRHALVIHLSEQRAAVHPRAPRLGIDSHAAERRQIDLHAAVAGRLS